MQLNLLVFLAIILKFTRLVIGPWSAFIKNGIVLIFFQSINSHPYNIVTSENIQSKKMIMFDSISQFWHSEVLLGRFKNIKI